MEGPSLVIATEEFAPYFGKKPSKITGTAKLPFTDSRKQKLLRVASWGKHFLLVFERTTLRIHFLMFGSYRINNPRENRIPKLTLKFGKDEIHFYSCAIRVLEQPIEEIYDWTIDIMSPKWSARKALKHIQAKPKEMVCDVLMDQNIFAGLGNIIKNEVLFRVRLHPKARVGDLSLDMQKALVRDARAYSLLFYKWKKINQLKRHWQIFRKKTCPRCLTPVIKEPTGKGQRLSHYCESCQLLEVHRPKNRVLRNRDLPVHQLS
jgi:endonuclease VIII